MVLHHVKGNECPGAPQPRAAVHRDETSLPVAHVEELVRGFRVQDRGFRV